MNAETILKTANRYMESCLEASEKTASSSSPLNKETIINIIQNCNSSMLGAYSLAHCLIYKSSEDEDETMPILNELEALYCDTYKPAFDKLFQEVKQNECSC